MKTFVLIVLACATASPTLAADAVTPVEILQSTFPD